MRMNWPDGIQRSVHPLCADRFKNGARFAVLTGCGGDLRLLHLRIGAVLLPQDSSEHESARPAQHHCQRTGQLFIVDAR
jgi:hypothetical protein